MERLRGVFETIGTTLGGLDKSQRLLIGSLVVVLLMTLFVVQQYAGTASMSPLLGEGYGAEDQQAAVEFLRANNIVHEVGPDGVVVVAAERRSMILAQMSQQPGALPSDKTLLFSNLIDKQSWTKSAQQNRQLETIALQNEVGAILSQWTGIRSARVILDVPDKRTLGAPNTAPTASVNVFSENGLDQRMVDAIAGFVAGSRSGLTTARVRIVDGTTGRQHRARDEGDMGVASALEMQAKIEERKRGQIADMLVYIPGVIVTVHAQVDATQREATRTSFDKEGEGTVSVVVSEQGREMSSSEPLVGSEAGVRANTGADISQSTATGSSQSESTTDLEYEPRFGQETERIVDRRGYATKINAVVNVPRPYFEAIWREREARKGEDGGEGGEEGEASAGPTDADLDEIVRGELTRIRGDVEGVIDTSRAEGMERGEVKVSMIPVMPEGLMGIGTSEVKAGLFGGGGGALGVSTGELVKTLGLGGLAAMGLGLVVFTAVRANKHEELPSAEELVGIPKALEADDEIVGEAEATEPALAGIELDEGAMMDRQILSQVQEMISENPQDAARLVSRWIQEQG